MQQILSEFGPFALTGFVSLCVGIGGALKYRNRNGNGKYITIREFGVFRKEVQGNFTVLFNKIDHVSERMATVGENVARIQGQHEQARPNV